MKHYEVGIDRILYPKGKIKVLLIVLITLLLPAISYTVYITGGIQYVYSHSMYIPILLASLCFGLKGGAIVAVIAGLLLGPFMPIDTVSGEPQLTANWIYRICIFLVVGILSGLSFDLLRRKIKRVIELSTHHRDTEIPNSASLIFNAENSVHMVGSIIINNYYSIINSLGKEIFTELMKAFYQRLKENFESATIVQADSYKLWLCFDREAVEQVVDVITKYRRDVFSLKGIPMYLDFSLGIAYRSDKDGIKKALQQADIAAFHAQQENLPHCIFDETQMMKGENNFELLGLFSKAMETGETELHYQPEIDLRTGDIKGVEALIRWNSPERGYIPPQDFIKAVEETYLINPMTEWVIEKSLMMIKALEKNGFTTPVSINISAKNLQNPDFFDRVIGIIKEQDVAYNLIEFEMTESSLMYNPDSTRDLLYKLRDYSIALSIDDFGTGYSSLAYLRRFPIDKIKLDRYFIGQMAADRGIEYIVQAAIELAHKLNITVVGEGVEDMKTEQMLINMGCDIAQDIIIQSRSMNRAYFHGIKTIVQPTGLLSIYAAHRAQRSTINARNLKHRFDSVAPAKDIGVLPKSRPAFVMDVDVKNLASSVGHALGFNIFY